MKGTRITLVLAALAAAGLGVGAAFVVNGEEARPHPLTTGGWSQVFFDGFDDDRLDSESWATCFWWDDGGCTIASNNELEWYQPDNVSVEDGILRLTAVAEDVVTRDGEVFPYSSGMVSTGPGDYEGDVPAGFTFTYGYVEMSAMIPDGTGLWPAFWMLPADRESRPEIDVMEVPGGHPSRLSMHVHFLDDGDRIESGESMATDDLSAGWHTFGLLWAEDELVWYLDGIEAWAYDGIAIPDEPMYLVANLAVGGDWVGSPDRTTRFPAMFEIDFIRVWQEQ